MAPSEERKILGVKNLSIYPGRGCQAFVYRMKCEVHLLALLLRRWPLRGSEKSILRKVGKSISRKAVPTPPLSFNLDQGTGFLMSRKRPLLVLFPELSRNHDHLEASPHP